jgi:hypothetical protein
MKLTKMIFDYWKDWMLFDDSDVQWMDVDNTEGIVYYDGYNATFWYLLNIEWYNFNNKLYAKTGCTEPYQILNDFDEDYLLENDYK